MTADDRFCRAVDKLPSRASVLEHVVAQVFKDCLEVRPLEVGWWRGGAELLKSLLLLGHRAYIPGG